MNLCRVDFSVYEADWNTAIWDTAANWEPTDWDCLRVNVTIVMFILWYYSYYKPLSFRKRFSTSKMFVAKDSPNPIGAEFKRKICGCFGASSCVMACRRKVTVINSDCIQCRVPSTQLCG